MKSVQFYISPTSPGFDQLPRAVKMAIRSTHIIKKSSVKTTTQTRTNLDTDQIIRGFESVDDPYNDAHYLTSNNIDADFDIDGSLEFCDSDGSEELSSLTIVEPGNGDPVAISRWLKGYDVL